jgi:hypothetical protein
MTAGRDDLRVTVVAAVMDGLTSLLPELVKHGRATGYDLLVLLVCPTHIMTFCYVLRHAELTLWHVRPRCSPNFMYACCRLCLFSLLEEDRMLACRASFRVCCMMSVGTPPLPAR